MLLLLRTLQERAGEACVQCGWSATGFDNEEGRAVPWRGTTRAKPFKTGASMVMIGHSGPRPSFDSATSVASGRCQRVAAVGAARRHATAVHASACQVLRFAMRGPTCRCPAS
jgi:hypothetical protein